MDIRIPLACVLVVGGVIGVALPVFEIEEQVTRDAQIGQDQAQQLGVLNEAAMPTWAEEVALDRHNDGHFYADVIVDGVTTRMLVDTGASVIALTGEDALAMGLHWDESNVVPVAQGANGVVYGVNTQLGQVRVGNFEASDVRAMIIPDGLAISLLGQSFLSTVERVQIAEDRMVLAN